jgi:hypothetical protein
MLCASLVLLSRKYFSCSNFFAPNQQKNLYIYNVVCFAHEKTSPHPNNLKFSKWNLFLKKSCLCWYFLTLVCFTLEVKHAQLIDTHSLTPKSTKASLCTCCVNFFVLCLVSSCINPIKVMFLSIDPVPNLHNLSGARPNRSHSTTSLFNWI